MRISKNVVERGKLLNGYDYEKQAWVYDGKYQDCGHPEEGEQTIFGDIFPGCNCYGRLHKGEPVV